MTDLKTPYATRLCLSGAESRRLLDTFRDFGVKHIQVSYYYLKRVFSDPLEFAEYAAPFTTVLIDSGTIYHKFKTPQEKDDFIKDYEKVPDMIRKITREKIMSVAQEFINSNTWVLAAVSSGDRDELLELNDKIVKLFPTDIE